MDLRKEFTIKGVWRIPESLVRCYGVLTYSFSKGLNLAIFGSLYGHTTLRQMISNHKINLIIGRLADGSVVTLLDAVGHEFGSTSIIESNYQISYMTRHGNYSFDYADKIDSITFSINIFDNFFKTLYNKLDYTSFFKGGKRKIIKFQPSPPKQIFHDNQLKCTLLFGHEVSWGDKIQTNVSIFKHIIRIRLDLANPLSFTDSIVLANTLKTTFTFFSTSKVYFDSVQFNEVSSRKTFDIIFYQKNRNSNESIKAMDLLADYSELGEYFDNMMAWFIKNSEFVYNGLSLYNDLLFLSRESAPQHFLNIAFALETFHSTFYQQPRFSVTEMKKFKTEKAKIKLTGEMLEKFNSCLSSFNRLTFKERLLALIDDNNEILSEYLGNALKFASTVTKYRNYLAHEHSKAQIISKENIDYYITMLKLIFDCSILLQVGIPKEIIKKIVKVNLINSYFKKAMPAELK